MRKRVAGLVFAVGLVWAVPSGADTILFDPDGAGPGSAVIVGSFDWAAGNSILRETTGEVLYQANLSAALSPGGIPVFANGTSGLFFTGVASMSVTPTATGFVVNPAGSSVFRIYAQSAPGNNLAGTGFAAGTVILEGTAIDGSGDLVPTSPTACPSGTSAQDPDGPGPAPPLCIGNLDQFAGPVPPTDNYPGVDSIAGNGSFLINIAVTSYDPAYFLTPPGIILVSATADGSNQLPFRQVDPAAAFWDGSAGVGSVGPINGLGTNIMAQSDASTTFQVIPEPATLTLLGIGLAGSAALRRRQKRASH